MKSAVLECLTSCLVFHTITSLIVMLLFLYCWGLIFFFLCVVHRFSIPMKRWKWRALFLSKPNSLTSCKQRWTSQPKRKRWVIKVWEAEFRKLAMELNDWSLHDLVIYCVFEIFFLFLFLLHNTNTFQFKEHYKWLKKALSGNMSSLWPVSISVSTMSQVAAQ